MKEQFVTYEIALALKELGFDECCLAVYFKDKFQLIKGFNINNVDLHVANKMDAILAPLWQQVIDWFEIEHKIYISFCLVNRMSDNIEYMWYLSGMNKDLEDYGTLSNRLSKSSFVARERAILKAISLSLSLKGETIEGIKASDSERASSITKLK